MAWTRQVLLNIDPNARVNPDIKTQARAWEKYDNTKPLKYQESRENMSVWV